MKKPLSIVGALLVSFVFSAPGAAAPAKSSRPKLSSLKLVVVSPKAEVKDSKGNVITTIHQGYVVWPTLYGSGHYKVKCRDKRAKGGWTEGWIKKDDVVYVQQGRACYVVPEDITVIEEPKVVGKVRAKVILKPGSKPPKNGYAHIYYTDRSGKRQEGWVPLQSVLKVTGSKAASR